MLCNLHCLKARLRLPCNKYQRHSSLNLVSGQLNSIPHGVFWITHTWKGQIPLPPPPSRNIAILKDMDLKVGMLK